MAAHHPPGHSADDRAAQDLATGHDPAHAHHPTAKTYFIVGTFLTIITILEVWAYYIPSFVASKAFVPSLLIMSAVKFATVVLFYMHLKYDHKVFRALFTGPFLIAATTLIGLMFLFGKMAVRLGILT
jgi:cytochrome c oxidase subunit IV